ncbi:MAG: SDR family oxidoreductase [Deltaproteobacteria bacterium]|nr:MAG: SDR family oxidoreductase [Deltaproteobacteria bacterium]
MEKRILVAGASGSVGFEVLKGLQSHSCEIVTFSRDPKRAKKLQDMAKEVRLGDVRKPKSLEGLCDNIDVVFSCLGASVELNLRQRASFYSVDYEGNRNLLREALRAGCSRFVYVSATLGESYNHTAYIQAHEQFVTELKASGLSYTIIRPTGIFSALEAFVDMARRGVAPLIGDGKAQSNPVHPADVAQVCVDNMWEGAEEVNVGGPEMLTRREMAGLAFQALGKKPRLIPVPAFLFRLGSVLLRPFHPRLSQMLQFVEAVSTHDALAPQIGTRTLSDYYASQLGLPSATQEEERRHG